MTHSLPATYRHHVGLRTTFHSPTPIGHPPARAGVSHPGSARGTSCPHHENFTHGGQWFEPRRCAVQLVSARVDPGHTPDRDVYACHRDVTSFDRACFGLRTTDPHRATSVSRCLPLEEVQWASSSRRSRSGSTRHTSLLNQLGPPETTSSPTPMRRNSRICTASPTATASTPAPESAAPVKEGRPDPLDRDGLTRAGKPPRPPSCSGLNR